MFGAITVTVSPGRTPRPASAAASRRQRPAKVGVAGLLRAMNPGDPLRIDVRGALQKAQGVSGA